MKHGWNSMQAAANRRKTWILRGSPFLYEIIAENVWRAVGVPLFLGCKVLFLGYNVPRRWCLFWDTKNFFFGIQNLFGGYKIFFWDTKNFFWDTKNFLGIQKTFFGIQKTFLGIQKTFFGIHKIFLGIQNVFSGYTSFCLTKIPEHHTNYKKS